MSEGHAHVDPSNKKIALLIAVLALTLAFSETLGKGAQAQVKKWRETAERYDSEPSTGEGRKKLVERAKKAEAKRDHAMAAYHLYELASAAAQIAIVMASASIIVSMNALAWVSGRLGIVGIVLSLVGFFAPTAVHLF